MKKILFIPMSLLLALLAYYPQPAIASPINKTLSTDPAAGSISQKLHEEFQNSFPNAEKVAWNEEKDQFIVSFVNAGILSRIVYNKHGEFVSSLRNYGEKELPYYLVSTLKKSFPGQTIYGVTEISAVSGISYYVKLEGPKDWIVVGLDPQGAFGILDSYKKQL